MLVGALRQLGISVALGSCLALGCGGEKSETPAPGPAASTAESAPPAPGAPAPMEEVWLTGLPDNFPEDVPRYPGAEFLKSPPPNEEGLLVGLSTSDEPAKVAAYVADALAAQGWSTQRVDAPEGIIVLAEKGDRSATYNIGTAEGKTKIDLLILKMP